LSVSSIRWKKAQEQELKTYQDQKNLWCITEDSFLYRNFSISLNFFNQKTILEVGCSPLASIHGIKNACKVGLDPLAYEYNKTLRKNTIHIQGRGEELPFKDGSFDLILCINTLDHVQNPDKVLREIKRCLKNGGCLLLWLQTYSTLRIIRRGLTLYDRSHPHHLSDNEVSDILFKLEYDVVNHIYKKPSFYKIISMLKSKLVSSGIKSLLANLFLGLHESTFICLKRILM